jgi:hypothetical protein
MLSFGVLIVLIAAISYLSINSLSKANDRVDSLYHKDMIGASKADGITINVATIGRLSNHAMVHAAERAVVADDQKEVLANLAEMRANLDAADKLFVNKVDLEKLAVIRNALPGYEQAEAALFRALATNDSKTSRTALDATSADRKTIRDASDIARASKQEHAEEQYQVSNQDFRSSRGLLLVATPISLVLGIVLSIFIARGFSIPAARPPGQPAIKAVAGELVSSVPRARKQLNPRLSWQPILHPDPMMRALKNSRVSLNPSCSCRTAREIREALILVKHSQPFGPDRRGK